MLEVRQYYAIQTHMVKQVKSACSWLSSSPGVEAGQTLWWTDVITNQLIIQRCKSLTNTHSSITRTEKCSETVLNLVIVLYTTDKVLTHTGRSMNC